MEFNPKSRTILLVVAGSHSYGTNGPSSDIDFRGIVVPPPEYVSGLRNFEQTQWKDEAANSETTLFGLRKFCELALLCNPNVIEQLFVDPSHIVMSNVHGQKLRRIRSAFLSKRAAKTFTGYAMSQLKRIRTHKEWIMNPPKAKPTREQFSLPEQKLVGDDQIGAAKALCRQHMNELAPWLLDADNQTREEFWEGMAAILLLTAQSQGLALDLTGNWFQLEDGVLDTIGGNLGFDSNFREYLQREKGYAQAVQHYDQYQAWLRNRNPARADLESKYRYDAKHAMHLVRLLRMGEELVRTGEMQVYRPDREELIRIRNGAWTYEELIEWAEAKEKEVRELVKTNQCVLPDTPDTKLVEQTMMDIQLNFREFSEAAENYDYTVGNMLKRLS